MMRDNRFAQGVFFFFFLQYDMQKLIIRVVSERKCSLITQISFIGCLLVPEESARW